MVVYPRPSHPSHIYTDIKAAGVKYLPQDLEASANYFKVLMKLIIGHLLQAGNMAVGGYHQVTGVIGIAIEHDEAFSPRCRM